MNWGSTSFRSTIVEVDEAVEDLQACCQKPDTSSNCLDRDKSRAGPPALCKILEPKLDTALTPSKAIDAGGNTDRQKNEVLHNDSNDFLSIEKERKKE